MTHAPQTPFDPEIKAFLTSELGSMGAGAIIYGLEAVLLVEAGEMASTGTTPEMTDGSAASVLASADAVAIVLGHGPEAPDAEIVAALAPHADELRETVGLADLACRADGAEAVGAGGDLKFDLLGEHCVVDFPILERRRQSDRQTGEL